MCHESCVCKNAFGYVRDFNGHSKRYISPFAIPHGDLLKNFSAVKAGANVLRGSADVGIYIGCLKPTGHCAQNFTGILSP